MRTLFLAAVACLLVAADAGAEYRRLPGPPADVNVGVALQRDDVLVAAGGVLTAHAPDGSS